MIYYLTFGQKHRQDAHAYLAEHPDARIHPDGYWEIQASSIEEAHDKARAVLGLDWSMLYAEEDFDKDYFPLGKIGEIV